ncbi:MAG: PQQ-binding-like beta-propeller repeat protein [Planctomycetaceae bacterium]|nr:PQQ-binding-like beta-propeller repeat protein [Planctomycetales bacterium]MCB9923716.1 PQQ-binding-like beta-propeller repeat protein [Planctomycetaceae bacterium]
MSAKKFIQLLEDNGVLDAATLREIRRQVKDKNVSAATVAKALVEKGKLTKFQATKLVGQATAAPEPGDDDESGLLLVEETPEDNEVVLLESAADEPEEVVGLTPVEDAGAALTPVGGVPASGSGGLELLDGGLEPIGGGGLDDLDAFAGGGAAQSLDPFSAPAQQTAATGGGSTKEPKPRREKKNQQDWGGKLMIGGGGLLLFLILAGGLLWYNLTKQSPLELYEAAEEAYRSESYSDAMAKFERFVKTYSSDENADDAQVRIALCRIRIVIGDPQKAYDTAMEVLPPVQELEPFSGARDELATLLPAIPEGFIKKAKQAPDTDGMEELIGKAEKALADLVNKPEYVPASKRPAERLKRIDEDILIVKRAISQDRDLAKAIVEIKEHAKNGKTVEAYQVYKDLLKVYPVVADDAGMQAAVLEITEKLKNLVKLEEEAVEATTADEPSTTEFRVVLASRTANSTDGVPRLNGQVVPILAAGSVYGLDAGTGKVLWRRYVGHVTDHHPQPLSGQGDADILVTDGHRQELIRLNATSGDLVWRLPIGEPFASPSIAGDQIYVATHSGKILQIDANSGNSSRRVAIPQSLDLSPGVAQIHPYLIQVGDHSNLYAISRDSLSCDEVVYFGHKAGTVATPPLIVQDHVLIAENAGPDYCLLHIFKITPGGDGPILRRPQAAIRLTGNVIVPMVLYGRRPLVVTDLGEVNVFNVDFNSEKDTVTTATAPLPASRAAPLLSYPVVEGTTLVLADEKLVKYQLQVTTKQITQKSVTNSSDSCIAPPRLLGDILIITRRLQGSVGATVSALQVDNFRKPEWETQLGTPIGRVGPAGNQLAAITAAGALFEIDSKVLQAKVSNEPALTVTAAGGSRSFTDQVEFAGGKVAFFNPAENEQALIYSPEAGSGRLRVVQLKLSGAKVTCVPVAFQDGLLAPLDSGEVMLANTTTGDNLVLPFQPKLGPGEDVKWRRPAVIGDAFVVVDDRKNVYRVEIKPDPKPFLAPVASGKLEVDIDSDLAAVGDTVYGVVRNSGGDVIVALNTGDLKLAKEFALTGRVVWGPVQVGDAVLCLSSVEGLLCFEAGANQRWANSAGCGGQPVGVPLSVDGDFLFALKEGAVARIAGNGGAQVAQTVIGEPLGAGPVAFGARLLLPGSDGALHVIKTPVAEGQ